MNIVKRWLTRLPQLRRDAAYLLLYSPLNVLAFCLVVPLLAAGVSTVVIGVGVLLLVVGLLVAGGFAQLARLAAGTVTGTDPLPSSYLRAEPGSGLLRRVLTPLKDPQRWMDLLWVIVSFPVSLLLWVLTVTWLALGLGGVLAPIPEIILELTIPDQAQNVAELLGLEPALLWMIVMDLTVGLIFLGSAPAVLRAMAACQTGLDRLLLTWRAEIGRLETSRAAVQRAEADTRRQLERDIHDGPQQGLVRLGMDLARARRQTADDPHAAAAILEEAMALNQQTLDELRRLSRGIAPPVLVDRGLAAALSEVATRSTVPVTVELSGLPEPTGLPDHVAYAAYFVASEALTNVNKHSGASRAHLTVTVHDARLHLRVEDDGVGGAALSKGHGLAGIAQRLDGVDGHLAVTSPAGGPTRIEAVIPCAS